MFELEVLDRIGPLAAEWDELADRLAAAPFLRPGWIEAWWRAFGAGRLEIVSLRRAGRLAAVLPLQRRLGRVRSTSNWHTPEFGMLATDELAARELAAVVLDREPVHLSLGFLDAARPELAIYRATAVRAGYRILERTLERSPYVVIGGTWEAYTRQLSRNRRSQIGRRRRRLEDLGELRLEVADGSQRLDGLLDELFRVEAFGWKGAGGSAIASRPATRRFYTEVARWAADRNWLRLAFLRLDGRPLAVQYLLEAGGIQYALKGGYDPGMDYFSPGIVLLQALLERAFATGVARFALLGGDEPYKVVLANGCEELVLFQAFAPSAAGLLHWTTWARGRPVAKRVQTAWLQRRAGPTGAG